MQQDFGDETLALDPSGSVACGKAVDFVRRNAIKPKPFFLWFNPTAPHGEAGRPFGAPRNPMPAPRHLGLYEGSSRAAIEAFKSVLERARIPATVRLTRGRDIEAACGQLASTR